MEEKPLNMAHQQHRRAEAYLKNKRFDDAIKCHHNAAELLLDAMKSTSSSRALESISLQHGYHLKQKDLIKMRKDQYVRVKKAMDHLKLLSADPLTDIAEHESNVQVAIYRTIREADSLLEILRHPREQPQHDQAEKDNVVIATEALELNPSTSADSNEQKEQQNVIKELLTVNHSLHNLVDKLIMQVELVKEENSSLKTRVEYLEAERRKYLILSNNILDLTRQTNFGVTNDTNYSPDDNSDFSFPPTEFKVDAEDQLSESCTTIKPNFDLTAFKDDGE